MSTNCRLMNSRFWFRAFWRVQFYLILKISYTLCCHSLYRITHPAFSWNNVPENILCVICFTWLFVWRLNTDLSSCLSENFYSKVITVQYVSVLWPGHLGLKNCAELEPMENCLNSRSIPYPNNADGAASFMGVETQIWRLVMTRQRWKLLITITKFHH